MLPKNKNDFPESENRLVTVYLSRPGSVVGSDSYAECLVRFSTNLRWWREKSKRKIADVAKEFGVATSTWGHWEKGGCLPTGENLCLLAEFTRIPIQHLLCPNAMRCPFSDKAAIGGP